jgi:hypothetical protein
MTDDQVSDIDARLTSFGWHYNAASEVFQATADDSLVEWIDVIAAMPDLSLNELQAFEDRKQRERRRNDCKTSAESIYNGPHFAQKRTAFERT